MLADVHWSVVSWILSHVTAKPVDDLFVAARSGLTVGHSVLERVDAVEDNEAWRGESSE